MKKYLNIIATILIVLAIWGCAYFFQKETLSVVITIAAVIFINNEGQKLKK